MKVMVFGKATRETESGVPPKPEEMEAMGNYVAALMAAGIIKEPVFGGLKPSSFGKRVRFTGKERMVIDGPFPETKELVAGFSMWDVESMEQAVEWAMKTPMAADCEIEIRPLYSPEELAAWDEGTA
jgi:PhnB protein